MIKFYIFIYKILRTFKVALSSLHTTFGIPYEMFIIKKMLLTGIDYCM